MRNWKCRVVPGKQRELKNMTTNLLLRVFIVITAVTSSAWSQLSINALSTFGGGDGWLTPAEYGFLSTGNNERGLAVGNGHLYLASRAQGLSIRILDLLTGSEAQQAELDTTAVDEFGSPIITGGDFALNMIAVGGDGVIYAANLASTATDARRFKVYRWATESALPSVAFSGVPLATRMGDSFDAVGSGASTRLVAGFGNLPDVPGNNGYTIIDPNDPEMDGFTNIGFAAGTTAAGDFRLGITFANPDQVIGAPNGITVRYTHFAGTQGTVDATLTLATAVRPMDFAVIAGIPLLATIETGGAATANTVHVYDLSDPANPREVATANNTTTGAPVANINGTGQVKWGPTNGLTATLYAMNSNNGIQAFTLTVPEPSSAALLAIAAAGFACRHRR